MTDNVDLAGENKIEFLSQVTLFQNMSQSALGTLNIISTEYEFQRGAIIAYEGDVADHLYIVRQGQLEAFTLDENERYVRQNVYSAGDYFDDQWLFEPSTHAATVRARRPGRMILVPRQAFLNFIKAQPSALNAIYPHLSLLAQDEIHRSRFHGYVDQPRRVNPTPPAPEETAARPAAQETIIVEGEELAESKKRLQRYAKLNLLQEEVVYFESRRSWKIMSAQFTTYMVAAFILFLIPVVLLGTSGISGTISLIVGAVLAGYPLFKLFVTWINWLNCFFFVTNKRVIRYENRPLKFDRSSLEVNIENVQSVSTETPSLIARWLNIGTAIITTAAQSGSIYFDFIDRPQGVETAINLIRKRNDAIGKGQHRESLRRSVEQYFDVDQKITPVADESMAQPARTVRRRGPGFMQQITEMFGRSERAGTITYHKHFFALFQRIILPALIGVILLLIYIILAYWFPTFLEIPAVFGFLFIFVASDLAWMVWVFEDWRNDTYQVTDRYIFDIDRLPLGLRESRKQAELVNIENVTVEQNGFFPSMLNFGNVSVETAGVDSNILFENVREPKRIQNEIFARRERFRERQQRREQERQQQDYAMLIDLYYQAVQNGRIVREPLPEIDTEIEEDEDEERPLQL